MAKSKEVIFSCIGICTGTIYVVKGDNPSEVERRLSREVGEPVDCAPCCVERERCMEQ